MDNVNVDFKCTHTLSCFLYTSDLISQNGKHVKTAVKHLMTEQLPLRPSGQGQAHVCTHSCKMQFNQSSEYFIGVIIGKLALECQQMSI